MILGKGLLAQGNITGMNRALGKVGFGNRSLSSSTADATQHCVLLVREKDYSSYLCGLLLEKSLKPHYFAVMAFNIETAIIKDSLRGGVHANTSPAKLRISWWREAIEEVYDGMLSDQKRAQPVVAAVARTIEDKRLTRRFFELMIDAREADLALQQKVSVEDVEEYSEKTHASLLKLCLEVVDVRDDGSDHVASHLARGIGIANAIRSAEALARTKGEITIPQSLMRTFEVPSKALLDPMSMSLEKSSDDNAKLSEAVFDFATTGNAHVEHARDYFKSLDKDLQERSFGNFLGGLETSDFFAVLEEANFDVFDPSLQERRAGMKSLPVQMMKTKYFGNSNGTPF